MCVSPTEGVQVLCVAVCKPAVVCHAGLAGNVSVSMLRDRQLGVAHQHMDNGGV